MEHELGEASAGGSDVVRKGHCKVLAGPDIRFRPYQDQVRGIMRSLLGLHRIGKDCVHEGFIFLQAQWACFVGVQDSTVRMDN